MDGWAFFSAVSKGAMTSSVAPSQANGDFGAFLKFSDFKGILNHGSAKTPKYMHDVPDGKAELKDARHLVGKDTGETEDAIKQVLGFSPKNMSVFSIRPAGENLAKFAGIFGDRGHSASHNGRGAIWGSKKLKAIAFSRSKGKLDVANTKQLEIARKALAENFKKALGGEIWNWGTCRMVIGAAKTGILPIKYYTSNIFPQSVNFDVRKRLEAHGANCWACPSFHLVHIKVADGPYAGFSGKELEYEQYAAWGPQMGQPDPGTAIVLANEVDRLGMECNEASWTLRWVMECYEKGLLTAKNIDGLEMTWGNVEATRALIKNMACRRGYGNVLAEGVRYASKKLGGESVNWAIYTEKGTALRGMTIVANGGSSWIPVSLSLLPFKTSL